MLQQISKRAVPDGQREIRLEQDGRVISRDRLFEPPEILIHDAEIVQELGIGAVDRAHGQVVLQRLLRAVQFLQHQPKAFERFDAPWCLR